MYLTNSNQEDRSSSDYIQFLRKRALKNQKINLSNGKTTSLNYATYLDQLDLASIDNECFSEKNFNGISLGDECSYPANTIYHVQHVNQPIFSYNNDIGLSWKVKYGSMGTNTNYFNSDISFSGISSNFTDISFATNGTITNNNSQLNNSPFSIEWVGYLFNTFESSVSFQASVVKKDNIHVWIGPNSLTPLLNNATIDITRNIYDVDFNSTKTATASYIIPAYTYVPIRIQYDNTTGYEQGMNFAYKSSPYDNFNYSSNSFYFYTNNFSIVPLYSPLISTPSVPGKLQTNKDSCASCTMVFQDAKHRRQWNIKKPQMLSIVDSKTFKM